MVFFGEYQVSFSGVGRIILPKKIRALLKGTSFILTKGTDHCLTGYDKANWENRAAELLQSSVFEENNSARKRFVFSSLVQLEIDDQGRFIIPKNLLEYADLKDKATIIGVADHFEVWQPDKWKKYIKKINP